MVRSNRIRLDSCFGLVIALVTAFFGASDSRAEILSFTFTDSASASASASASDTTGVAEVTQIEVTFDNSTGDFVTHLTADPSTRFAGTFRVNLHVINPDTPTFTANPAWFPA